MPPPAGAASAAAPSGPQPDMPASVASAAGSSLGFRHTLEVRITDDAPQSTDPLVHAARRRLNLERGGWVRFWQIGFVHLADAQVENSAAWRDSEAVEAQSASRRALQSLHEASQAPGVASLRHSSSFENVALQYKHRLMATAAASWTVADLALIPVAMLLGLIPAGAMDDDLQPTLGPVPPFALRSRVSALDLSRWTRQIVGPHSAPLSLAGESGLDLPRMSLSGFARHVRAASQAVTLGSTSRFTLCLTEQQLCDFERAASRADDWRAACLGQHGEAEPRKDLRALLITGYEATVGAEDDFDHWSNSACIATQKDFEICQAAHLVSRSVGNDAFDKALDAFRADQKPLANVALDELAFLDVRLGSTLPPVETSTIATGRRVSNLDLAHNGVFLFSPLHFLFDESAFLITPSLNFVHVALPRHGSLIGPAAPVLRDAPGTGEPDALKHKLAAVHLAAFSSLCALFLTCKLRFGRADAAATAACRRVAEEAELERERGTDEEQLDRQLAIDEAEELERKREACFAAVALFAAHRRVAEQPELQRERETGDAEREGETEEVEREGFAEDKELKRKRAIEEEESEEESEEEFSCGASFAAVGLCAAHR